MATNVRGRSGARPRSTSGSSRYYSTRPSSAGWGRTRTANKRGSTERARGNVATTGVPTEYKTCYNEFVTKISSYKMLYNQTRGPARYTRPSPTTLNSFANWINNGAVIQTVSAAQVSRWAKTTTKNFNTRTAGPTVCKDVLWAKFGKNTIKAVARTKTGSFMVATSPTVNGRPFSFPK